MFVPMLVLINKKAPILIVLGLLCGAGGIRTRVQLRKHCIVYMCSYLLDLTEGLVNNNLPFLPVTKFRNCLVTSQR